jgi:hypothetical protein
MTPTVTVVLPVRNGERLLGESIRSVLAQDFEDFSLDVYDDGSTDHTADVIRGFSDSRIRVFHSRTSRGLFATLNAAFEGSRSELTRIWAHDDRMVPTCLRRFVDFCEQNPTAGMAYCTFTPIDIDGRRLAEIDPHAAQHTRTPALAGPFVSALLFYFYGCLPGNISTVLLRRSVWKAVGGFIEGSQQSPDYDMWVRVSSVAPVGFIPDPLVDLREHPLQLSQVGRKDMTTIAEERAVIDALRQRLAGVVDRAVLDRHWRQHRGRQHVHWIVRAIARGRLSAARRGWRSMRDYGDARRQAVTWLLSANGRFGCPPPDPIVDELLPRCLALDSRDSV